MTTDAQAPNPSIERTCSGKLRLPPQANHVERSAAKEHREEEENGMDGWVSLGKVPMSLHISYGATYTNNLTASDVRVRTSPNIGLFLDLDGNLSAKDKQSNAVRDAEELLSGGFNDLVLVQLISEDVMRRLGEILQAAGRVPKEWLLTISLRGERKFTVRPEPDQGRRSLYLHVLEAGDPNQTSRKTEASHE